MRSVILLSGGIDSAVLLADRVRVTASPARDICAVTFDYGQNAKYQEIEAAGKIAGHYGIEQRTIKLADVFGECALRGTGQVPAGHAAKPDATVVPGRNLVFISVAVAVAAAGNYDSVMFGANQDDLAGYRDCRREFIDCISQAAWWGSKVTVHAPFNQHSKAAIMAYGKQIGVPLHVTWSCYQGGDTPCGVCGACELRDHQ
jgi:7-cyano-7-deazaguanine synthase